MRPALPPLPPTGTRLLIHSPCKQSTWLLSATLGRAASAPSCALSCPISLDTRLLIHMRSAATHLAAVRHAGQGRQRALLHQARPVLQQVEQLDDERVQVGRQHLRLHALREVHDGGTGVGLGELGGGVGAEASRMVSIVPKHIGPLPQTARHVQRT